MCLASPLAEKNDRSMISKNAIWEFTWILPDPKRPTKLGMTSRSEYQKPWIFIHITHPPCHFRVLVWKTNTKTHIRTFHVLCCFPKTPWTWLMVLARSLLTIIPTFWQVRCSFMFLHYACNFQRWWYQRLCVSKIWRGFPWSEVDQSLVNKLENFGGSYTYPFAK